MQVGMGYSFGCLLGCFAFMVQWGLQWLECALFSRKGRFLFTFQRKRFHFWSSEMGMVEGGGRWAFNLGDGMLCGDLKFLSWC